MGFARIVLFFSAVAYAAVGVPFLLAPEAMAALVDVSLASTTADNDVRAVYGGANLGFAAFLLLALRRAWIEPALWLVMLSMGGLALARVFAWTLHGLPTPIGLALHAAEIVGAVAAWAALRTTRVSA